MPLYARDYTCPASSRIKEELWVEGDIISYVNISFPPGSHGLLRVAIFYGEKKIYPWEEDSWIAGDAERIETHAVWELPESPCRLLVIAENDDGTYDHKFFVRIETAWEEARKLKFRVGEEGALEVEI
jgi:hypothetical protein